MSLLVKTHSSTQIRSLPLQVGLHQGEHERDRLVGHRPLLHLPQVRGYFSQSKDDEFVTAQSEQHEEQWRV